MMPPIRDFIFYLTKGALKSKTAAGISKGRGKLPGRERAMTFEQWMMDFIADKIKIDSFSQSATHAVHSITRFIDEENRIWETAQTYTGRLAVRSGAIDKDDVTIKWGTWTLQHDVEMPNGKHLE